MATPRKPAAKAAPKTTTRRPRKTTPKSTVTVELTPEASKVFRVDGVDPYTMPLRPLAEVKEEEKQAKLTAYSALKGADLPIPEGLVAEVEAWIAEAQAQQAAEAKLAEETNAKRESDLAEANKTGPWYVRNGYPAPFSLRLDRQTEKRRLELKARGTPGDMHPLKDEDLQDPILRRNVQLGIIEVIPAGEANQIIAKQTHNMVRREHTPLSILRNELGQPYQQGAVRVEAEFNSQGVTVATLDPAQMQGHVHDKQVAGARSFGGMQRVQPGQPQYASGFVPTGGNPAIISQSPTAHYGELAGQKIADDLARRKGVQGPGAGLGGLSVVVDPVVRT